MREAAATGAGTLAVACPFCTVMLDDGVQSAGADLRVVDVATLLSEAIDGTTAGHLCGRGIELCLERRARASGSAPSASSPSSAAPTIGSLGDTSTRASGATR